MNDRRVKGLALEARPTALEVGGRPGTPRDRGWPRPRVAHVTLSLDCGGLERVVVGLAREFVHLDHPCAVACLEQAGSLASQAEDAGASVVAFGKRPGFRPEIFRPLEAWLLDWKPDVLHTHQVGALLYAGPAARKAGVPTVVHTEHGKHYGGRTTLRWLGRAACRQADRVFCVSADIAEEVRSRKIAPLHKVRVVPNGIEAIEFAGDPSTGRAARVELGIPPDVPTIGTVGRLVEVKRQGDLIRAFGEVRSALPTARLLIVGDGPLRGDLERLASQLGLEDAIHFAGYQARPAACLAAMDVFAMTSSSEGMPLAILEAWAASLPVVATRVGGLGELVIEGENGILVEPGDMAALARALIALSTNPSMASRLGEAGREMVGRSFSLRSSADRYREHYLELLGRSEATLCVSSR